MRTNVIPKKFSDLEAGNICIYAKDKETYLVLVVEDGEDENALLKLPFDKLPVFENVSNSTMLLLLIDARFEVIALPNNITKPEVPEVGSLALTEFGPALVVQDEFSSGKMYLGIRDGRHMNPKPRHFFVCSQWRVTQKLSGIENEAVVYDSSSE